MAVSNDGMIKRFQDNEYKGKSGSGRKYYGSGHGGGSCGGSRRGTAKVAVAMHNTLSRDTLTH